MNYKAKVFIKIEIESVKTKNEIKCPLYTRICDAVAFQILECYELP